MTPSAKGFRQTGIRPNLHLRARALAAARAFLDAQGFLEVETPNRIPAPAPEAHIDPQPAGRAYLHTSPELCMKRLLAAGYPKIYQLSRCHRRGERGQRHLPEFTLLEWYQARLEYVAMMEQTQALVCAVAAACRPAQFPLLHYQGRRIDLSPPWERLTVAEAFDRYAPMSMAAALAQDRFDETIALSIEPRLGQAHPVLLCDYPLDCGALAQPKAEAPHLVERFELYIGGIELCNAFGELRDPVEQRRRFEMERAQRRAVGKSVAPLPEAFLSALEHMPPAAGNALGMDRLAMLLTDSVDIADVTAFIPEEL
ncbi:MAG: EF-P lysine aminoacylase EpmA [Desulfosarcinaceae bacterium]|nr:EF-P lysine aminoacylase EpmA [Desulfosarcinaceae bacterium]